MSKDVHRFCIIHLKQHNDREERFIRHQCRLFVVSCITHIIDIDPGIILVFKKSETHVSLRFQNNSKSPFIDISNSAFEMEQFLETFMKCILKPNNQELNNKHYILRKKLLLSINVTVAQSQ